jgi:hypothetical protein
VNQACALTAGGSLTNGFAPTTTLGCGSWGGNSISENLDYKHLYERVRGIGKVSNTRQEKCRRTRRSGPRSRHSSFRPARRPVYRAADNGARPVAWAPGARRATFRVSDILLLGLCACAVSECLGPRRPPLSLVAFYSKRQDPSSGASDPEDRVAEPATSVRLCGPSAARRRVERDLSGGSKAARFFLRLKDGVK